MNKLITNNFSGSIYCNNSFINILFKMIICLIIIIIINIKNNNIFKIFEKNTKIKKREIVSILSY